MRDLELWKQRHEEMLREAEQARLARALKTSRKRRDVGWAFGLARMSKKRRSGEAGACGSAA
jgi:hypothetical protein